MDINMTININSEITGYLPLYTHDYFNNNKHLINLDNKDYLNEIDIGIKIFNKNVASKFTEKIYKFFINIYFFHYDSLLFRTCKQPFINSFTGYEFGSYSMQFKNNNNNKIKYSKNNYTGNKDDINTISTIRSILNIDDNNIIWSTLYIHSLKKYIDKIGNIGNSNIFIPISCKSNNDKYTNHVILLIINKKNKNVYLFDPNGRTNYLKKMCKEYEKYPNINICFEKLLSDYFKIIDYNYIFINYWYSSNFKSMNTNIGKNMKEFAQGCCSAWIIFIAQYIHVHNTDLPNLINNLSKLSYEELNNVIYNYQTYLYNKIF